MTDLPKKLFLYWDHGPMSWLQSQTVTTFHDLNPDWEITVYVPPMKSASGVKYIPDYLGADHFPWLKTLPYLKLVTVDLEAFGIQEHLPDILRSDILRYQLLHTHGGVWSDFDVIWIRPMTAMCDVAGVGGDLRQSRATVCYSHDTEGWHNIGVLMALPGHDLYRDMVQACQDHASSMKAGQVLDHQEFGVALLNRHFPTLAHIQHRYPDVVGVPYDTFYPYPVTQLELLWKQTALNRLHERVMGVHWFNGHPLSKAYVNGRTGGGCSMTGVISRYVVKVKSGPVKCPESSREKGATGVNGAGRPWMLRHRREDFFHATAKFIEPTAKVLDLGCGIRPMTFFRPDLHVMVDSFGEYVAMLQHEYGSLSGCVVLQNEALEFAKTVPDAGFDTVFLLDVIEYLPKEEGLQLLAELERIAKVQVVVFTPLGSAKQECEGEDADGWGLSVGGGKLHRSTWVPDDFPDDWQLHLCEDFHEFNWRGEPTPVFGAFFAIKTISAGGRRSALSERQRSALRFMPELKPEPDAVPDLRPEILSMRHQLDEMTRVLTDRMGKMTRETKKETRRIQKETGKLGKTVLHLKVRPTGWQRLRKNVKNTLRSLIGTPPAR